MSLLKLYRGPTLKTLINEITEPVCVKYNFGDEPHPELLTVFDDLKALSEQISIEMSHILSIDVETVTVWGLNKRELSFAGPPIGTEVAALVSAIVVAGRNASGLSLETRQALKTLNQPINLQVFTSPT